MRKTTVLFLLSLFLSGCATYKFTTGQEPDHKGYVVSRDNYTILEYTVGSDNSVPSELDLASKRFRRRRKIVEDYYKKMGYIENRCRMAFWNPGVYFVKMILGVFRLPAIAISDYKYRHNSGYREKIRKLEQEKDIQEEARINKLKQELENYIQKDLASETGSR